MNGDHPDPQTPHPDQETIDAWRASAEAEDHARIRLRDAEEAHAKAYSRPTRILGILVIGGVMMQYIAAFSRQDIELGGAFYLVAGILILKGKQTGVRFVAFMGVLVALGAVSQLSLAQILGQPVATKSGWKTFADIRFWIEYASPAAFLSASGNPGFRDPSPPATALLDKSCEGFQRRGRNHHGRSRDRERCAGKEKLRALPSLSRRDQGSREACDFKHRNREPGKASRALFTRLLHNTHQHCPPSGEKPIIASRPRSESNALRKASFRRMAKT